ncbi:ABC transporter ATP-binding protein [Bacillus sp. T33-2]|uniref:ABC transporter ATP-binding protein n=1 Tax=Bacillus sp. T33-2 TaxID=2054168 RepID=UPI000C758AA7|nr:ABC transporter ATP-binding protein [Bacillus sp. T33-2]PLR91099.1 bacitracin ABC transporter ATP-binding protein [Bacillus sp. T33-2]
MQSIPIVQLSNVKKTIGKKPIIKGINLNIYPGEILGLLGPNGAGKTTTIRMMVGLISITDGDIKINGVSIADKFEQAISYVGAIVENPEMYKFMTGYQNLEFFAKLSKGVSKERIGEVVKLVGLENAIHNKVKTYSLGMRQRLGIAQALLHKPKLLILDEPTNGLDPAGIREIRDYLRKLAKEENLAVLVSSHLLAEMELMADRIAIIQHGELIDVQRVNDFIETTETTYLLQAEPRDEALNLINIYFNEIETELKDDNISIQLNKDEIPDLVGYLVNNDIKVYGVIPTAKSLEERFLEVTGGTSIA